MARHERRGRDVWPEQAVEIQQHLLGVLDLGRGDRDLAWFGDRAGWLHAENRGGPGGGLGRDGQWRMAGRVRRQGGDVLDGRAPPRTGGWRARTEPPRRDRWPGLGGIAARVATRGWERGRPAAAARAGLL